MTHITYSDTRTITPGQFVDLLVRSTLAARRPVHDLARIAAMLEHADLLCTAWVGKRLVGAARSVTDFAYCCYLSDLAVDEALQCQGIGVELICRTQARLHPAATLILLAAPRAREYYPRIGMTAHPSAWTTPAAPLLPARVQTRPHPSARRVRRRKGA